MKIEGDEIWVPVRIKGYEETHEISNLGRIRSFFATSIHKDVPFVVKPGTCNSLVICRLNNGIEFKIAYVANEVLRSFGPERLPGDAIVYLDGDKNNCKYTNLRLGTRHRDGSNSLVSIVNTVGNSCKTCPAYPLNYVEGGAVPKCKITGILKMKTDFGAAGCLSYNRYINLIRNRNNI